MTVIIEAMFRKVTLRFFLVVLALLVVLAAQRLSVSVPKPARAKAQLSSQPPQQQKPRQRVLTAARPVIAEQKIPSFAAGKVWRKVPLKRGEKALALTFDDGPDPKFTPRVLRALAAQYVRATFFMVGNMAQEHPKIARLVRDGGHAVGAHSWNHPSRPRDAAAQITRTNAVLRQALGFEPSLFRPPYGLLHNGMARRAMQEKQAVIMWSADANDWKYKNAARIAHTIERQAGPGGIVLMHDGGGNRSATVAALPHIIRVLRACGYRFVTVPELLKLRTVAPPKKTKKNPEVRSRRVSAVKVFRSHGAYSVLVLNGAYGADTVLVL